MSGDLLPFSPGLHPYLGAEHTHTHTTRTGILLLLAAQALDSDREPTKTLSSFK